MAVHSVVADDRPAAGDLNPDEALRLLRLLKSHGYRFVTPTPATHRQVLKHPGKGRARDLRDVLGWSLPFTREAAPRDIVDALEAAGALRETPDGLRSTIRVSSLDDDLFIHSAFPPDADDAVFFGPDTYRFARLLKSVLADGPAADRVIDLGTGSGAGAVVAAKAARAREIVVTDVNARALDVARINLAAAGLEAQMHCGSALAGAGPADLIVANPPFIAGGGKTYRDGGDMLGAKLSFDWTQEGAAALAPGGRFVLYTGSTIVDGRDGLREALEAGLDPAIYELAYEEIDPDIFGGQLAAEAYRDAERIAAVGAVIRRR